MGDAMFTSLIKLTMGRRCNTVELTQARIRDGYRAYAIGDIHGRADLLHELLHLVAQDAVDGPAEKSIIYLGDYIDRGNESRQVIDLILERSLPSFRNIYIKGNHEEAMLTFLEDPLAGADWLRFGGMETLLSYGVGMPAGVPTSDKLNKARDELARKLPGKHLKFLEGLTDWHIEDDYMFVHAAIAPERTLKKQRPQDLRWGHESFLSHNRPYEKVIVHGHTITEKPEFHNNHIGIDTGAYYSGQLTCLVLEGRNQRIIHTSR